MCNCKVLVAVAIATVLVLISAVIYLLNLDNVEQSAALQVIEKKYTGGLDILPNSSQCGRLETTNRILGGKEAALGEYPWTALLRFKIKHVNHKLFKCEGILISSMHILTAAHCFDKNSILLYVRLGEHNVEQDIDCDEKTERCADPPVNVVVTKIMIHEEFIPNDQNHYNDIALLKLEKPVNFTHYVEPICLPTEPLEYMPKKFVSAGWGATLERSESDVKMAVMLPFVNRTKCNEVYEPDNFIKNTQICAGGIKDEDTCVGNSGGALMVPDNPSILMGITSYSISSRRKQIKCGAKGIPGVYTYVPAYMDWIMKKIVL